MRRQNFGAEPKRIESIRYLEFDLDKLDRSKKAAYRFPDREEILALHNNVSKKSDDVDYEGEYDEEGENGPVGSPAADNKENKEDLSVYGCENGNPKTKDITEQFYDANDVILPREGVSGPQ